LDEVSVVSTYTFEQKMEQLERRIDRLLSRVDELERQLGYKAEERHEHRGYAQEHHYH